MALRIILCVVGIILIGSILMQKSKTNGFIGSTYDTDATEKRGFDLLVFRSTIVLTIAFFTLCVLEVVL